MRFVFPRILIGLFVGFLCLPTVGCDEKKTPAAHQSSPAVPVVTAAVDKRDEPLILPALGTVAANQSVTVMAQVTGYLDTVHFKNGQDVAQSDLLFCIDPTPFKLNLEAAQARLAQARSRAKESRTEFDRRKKLVKTGAITREDYDQKAAAAATAQDEIKVAQAQVDIAKQNLDYATIKAPLAGRAGRRLVDPGNLIRQGRDQLVVINQIQPIKVRFSLSAEYLDEIKDFQSKDPLKVQAVIPGYDGPPEHGQLTFVNNQINPKTGMIDLEATFPNQKRALWPGQFVKTRLVLTEQKNLTIAPYRGVQKGPQGYYAFVVQDDQTVKTQAVKIGRRMDEEVVIESGLKPGQKVVVDGQLTLRNGSKIKEAKSSTDSKKGGSQSSSDAGGSSGGQG